MRRVSAMQLVPGMVVAEDVFSFNGQLLIPKGTKLTDTAITILGVYDVLSVRIKDTKNESEPDCSLSYSERIKSSPAFQIFKEEYDEQSAHFKDALQAVTTKDAPLDTEDLLEGTLALMDDAFTTSSVLDMLHCMREYDNSTFAHSINVALICNVAAKWVGMTENEVRTATACGLFHDIGKLLIPQSILAKPASLTLDEYDIIKQHPIEGFQLLEKQKVDKAICDAALMHHERADGSGYPLGLKADTISRYAGLVSIADVYDAMTAARVYRGPLCPFTVIELFEKEGLQKYHPQYIMTFLENVVNTYILNRCRLNNGQDGEIVYINRDNLSRPMIQCGTEYINLAEHPELTIESLI